MQLLIKITSTIDILFIIYFTSFFLRCNIDPRYEMMQRIERIDRERLMDRERELMERQKGMIGGGAAARLRGEMEEREREMYLRERELMERGERMRERALVDRERLELERERELLLGARRAVAEREMMGGRGVGGDYQAELYFREQRLMQLQQQHQLHEREMQLRNSGALVRERYTFLNPSSIS